MSLCQFSVEIDQDDHVGYEVNGLLRQVFNRVWVPIINAIPENKAKWVVKTSESMAKVRKYATSFRALEILYSLKKKERSLSLLDRKIWIQTNNAKAIRNRFKLVKKALKRSIRQVLLQDHNVRIASLGCGSARALLELLAEEERYNSFKLFLIDRSQKALVFGRQLVQDLRLSCPIKWVRAQIWEAAEICLDFRPNLIEMVGLLDYFDDEEASNLLNMAYRMLAPGGILIAGNIKNNIERPFITKIIRWPMVYREPHELGEIISRGGFGPKNIAIIYEPLAIHGIALCQK
jgi:SAM-dependent methyltransferase